MKRTSKRPTRSAVKFTPAGWPERLARQVALVACPPVLRGERRHPEPVREFESEIHKFLSLNNLRVLSLIKVDSLLARTYVGERRILGQAPREGIVPPSIRSDEMSEVIDKIVQVQQAEGDGRGGSQRSGPATDRPDLGGFGGTNTPGVQGGPAEARFDSQVAGPCGRHRVGATGRDPE